MLVQQALKLCAIAAATLALAGLPVESAEAQQRDGKSRAAAKSAPAKSATRKAATKRTPARKVARAAPPRPSVGKLAGLHQADDPLDLKSSVALVVDEQTDEVVFSKNPNAVLPIASITKLMTALVITEAGLSLDETLTVTQDDVDATAGTRSRLKLGTQLSRGEMLHLALMASENRAAHLLGRTFPGGMPRFVGLMNAKARQLGMDDTRYVEPTGLSADNRSSAADLARLVRAASLHPVIRDYSTSLEASVPVGRREVQFRNSNGLVRNPEWEILLQKTGYIAAAGRCVVMQAQLAGRKFIMVLLDSAGRYSRIADAERIRQWLSEHKLVPGLEVPAVPGLLPAATSAAPVLEGPVVGPLTGPLVGPLVRPVSIGTSNAPVALQPLVLQAAAPLPAAPAATQPR